MPPREIFPNPKQVRALTPKSEAYAEKLRSFMPPQELTDSGEIPPGYELRRPNEEERQLMMKAEQFLDETFRFFSVAPPEIHLPSLCILQKKEEDSHSMSSPAIISGHIDMHLQMMLTQFNPQLPDGARRFLHIVLHEFTHAKSKNLWTIGRKTTRRTSGLDVVTEHFQTDSSQLDSDVSNARFFIALNEAITETLTILTCESLLSSSWFRETYGENEERTRAQREKYCAENDIYDAEIVAVSQDSNGEPQSALSYKNERIVLSFLLDRIAQESTIPRQDVFRLFVQDYAEGTMERTKPLLRATFGPDILRVLAVWTPNELQTDESIYLYLKEKDPNIRDIMANNYLTKRGSIPQSL
ncbi:MAG: hypothetical protein QX199_15755 [Methylococcaceae bacterium]